MLRFSWQKSVWRLRCSIFRSKFIGTRYYANTDAFEATKEQQENEPTGSITNAAVAETVFINDKIEETQEKKQKVQISERMLEFRRKLRAKVSVDKLDFKVHPQTAPETLLPWPNHVNPHTGEVGGPAGPEPTRYGDWERKGIVTDF